MTQSGEWTCQVSPAGHLPGTVRQHLDDYIGSLRGKKVKIRVSPYRKQRSSNQNRYYFGVVVKAITEMFREHGNNVDEEDVHTFLKMRVGKLAQVFVTPEGEVVKGLGSTAKLSTVEFETYLTKCKAFAAEYGVIIPDPNMDDAYDGSTSASSTDSSPA